MGKNIKNAVGILLNEKPSLIQTYSNDFSPEVKKALERHKANELIREQQQGLGKPIISTKFKNQQVVAVGNTVYISKWKTFPDFLSSYLKSTMERNGAIQKSRKHSRSVIQYCNATISTANI